MAATLAPGQQLVLDLKRKIGTAFIDTVRTKKLTQSEVARICGTSPDRISKIMLQRYRHITLDTLTKYSLKLGMTIDFVVTDPKAETESDPR